jgi:hypothetical protein
MNCSNPKHARQCIKTDTFDTWYAAALLLAERGDKAREYATRRISQLTNQGNTAEAAVWADILASIFDMQRPKIRWH